MKNEMRNSKLKLTESNSNERDTNRRSTTKIASHGDTLIQSVYILPEFTRKKIIPTDNPT